MLNFEAARIWFPRRLFETVLDQDCALCGARSRALVCERCDVAVPRCDVISPRIAAVDDVVALFHYRFPMDRVVQRFKYAGDLALGRWLAQKLAARAALADRPSLIVAPPSTKERLRRRGFNPALEIAKAVARELRVTCALEGLVRTRETTPQPGLTRTQRRRNLQGALACAADMNGLHVALVDDVLTTGATAEASARVLKKAGAERVSVWVVARTPEPHAR